MTLKNDISRISCFLRSDIKKRKAFYVFFLRIGLLIVFWYIFYAIASNFQPLRNFILNVLIPPFERSITLFGETILNIFGYSAISYDNVILIEGNRGIRVEMGCWAIDLMALFVAFIVACPGKILNKLWFTISGVFLIHILNIFRIAALCVVQDCCPKYMDFNHHFLFKAIVYLCIFIMWAIWIRRYTSKKS